jgi:poly(A) polymerase
MPEPWTIVSGNEVLRRISLSLDENDYLVGGSVRDLLLGKDPLDYDILTFGNVWDKAVSLAACFGSKPFWMDEERGIARTVSKEGITVDVCAPKGKTLDEDLKNRDITINAIALNLTNKEIYDPVSGIADLDKKLIRAVSVKGFSDDALRTLRCLRFAAVLGFSIDSVTRALIEKYAPGLTDVAPERIKQELASALSCRSGSKIFGLMEATGVREILFPGYDDIYQGVYHRWPLIKHAILVAESVETLISGVDELLPGAGAMLSEEIEDGIDRACLLRFASFIHDIGKPSTREDKENGMVHFYGHAGVGAQLAGELCRNLKFSSSFCSTIKGLIEMHMRVLDLACGGIVTIKAMHRLIKNAVTFVPELLLLSFADAIATGKDPGYKGIRTDMDEIIRRIWAFYTEVYLKNRKQPLLNGDDVMAALGIKPGPEVGRLLGRVEEARAEGLISKKNEALEFIKSKS